MNMKKQWTTREQRALQNFYDEGHSAKELSQMLGRSLDSINKALSRYALRHRNGKEAPYPTATYAPLPSFMKSQAPILSNQKNAWPCMAAPLAIPSLEGCHALSQEKTTFMQPAKSPRQFDKSLPQSSKAKRSKLCAALAASHLNAPLSPHNDFQKTPADLQETQRMIAWLTHEIGVNILPVEKKGVVRYYEITPPGGLLKHTITSRQQLRTFTNYYRLKRKLPVF